jgi:2-dehydro-3-deoxygluconokinase
VANRTGRETIPASKAPKVVDPTGAGDSFNGAYLAARIAGASQAEAAREGHRVASIVIGEPGALVDPRLVRSA